MSSSADRRDSVPPPPLIWAICTTARSGSSWLSQLVASTGVLGFPEEYLLEWPSRCKRLGLSANVPFDQYVALLLARHSSPNGVFAVKGSIDEMTQFFKLFPSLPCVWLVRRDKLEQAVSWYRAHDGGLWSRSTPLAAPPLPRDAAASLPYSLPRLRYFLDEIARREHAWNQFFAANRVLPLVVHYEELSEAPLEVVRRIADFLGVGREQIRCVESSLRVVRDDTSAAWVARLAEDLRGI